MTQQLIMDLIEFLETYLGYKPSAEELTRELNGIGLIYYVEKMKCSKRLSPMSSKAR